MLSIPIFAIQVYYDRFHGTQNLQLCAISSITKIVNNMRIRIRNNRVVWLIDFKFAHTLSISVNGKVKEIKSESASRAIT